MHLQPPLTDIPDGIDNPTVIILLHGRGGQAKDMLAFAKHHLPPAHLIALQADGNQWYPRTFLAPRHQNEPDLSAALQAIERAVLRSGVPCQQIVIAGFSQGACLAVEFAARQPSRYKGILAFSGGLIGESITPPIPNGLQGTPVLLGCSEHDPYIPASRVRQTEAAFRQAAADVTMLLYPGDTHTITQQELAVARKIIVG